MSATSIGQPAGLARVGEEARKAVVVAGPTASGKSALALRLAEEFGGVVINADSMQVYAGLEILTAQPGPAMAARAPHRLYGVLAPDDPCSVGRWLALATAAAGEAWRDGRLPVVVGGTGLYLQALIEGLSPIPEIPDAIRAEARERLERLGNARFHEELARRDPVTAARLHVANSQRLARAWEVMAATGRPLADWQGEAPRGRLEADIFPLLVSPSAAASAAACDGRFLAMIGQGALAEAAAMLARGLDPRLPACKALGLPELIAHLRGGLDLDDAVAAAQNATRRYAKRQRTWFRHQLAARHVIYAQFSESLSDEIFSIIRQFLLTLAL